MRKLSPWLLLVPIVAIGAAVVWRHQQEVTVSIVAPTRGPSVDAIYATGTVEPTVMMPIAPRTGARLAEINVDEGSTVRKGQVLARLDDADLDSTVEELQARANYAKAQYERIDNLVNKGFMSRAEVDRARADLDAANASVRRARSLRDFMALTSPADGLVIKRDGERGQFIPAGQAVFVLSCCAPLRVVAEVDEEDISRVFVGQRAVMRADALPGEVIEGKVKEITPKGDPVARSYRVRLQLANPERLKVGMTVDANLIVAERQDALLVPTSAVQDKAVWTLDENKRLKRVAVKPGIAGTARTEIVEGLAPDARVVDSPGPDMREGSRARERKPAEAKK